MLISRCVCLGVQAANWTENDLISFFFYVELMYECLYISMFCS